MLLAVKINNLRRYPAHETPYPAHETPSSGGLRTVARNEGNCLITGYVDFRPVAEFVSLGAAWCVLTGTSGPLVALAFAGGRAGGGRTGSDASGMEGRTDGGGSGDGMVRGRQTKAGGR